MTTAPWLLAFGAAIADLATKAWAQVALDPMPRDRTGGWLRLELVHNPGIALGLGAGRPGWVMAASALGVVVVAIWLARAHGVLLRTGLGFALGGGAGNLVDRVAHGWVTDWIHVVGYPATFNLADVAVRSGMAIVLVSLLVPARTMSTAAPTPRSRLLPFRWSS